MNGVELAKAVRKLRPGLPILLASGYAELPSSAGIDLPRIGKPYQQDQLAAEITKVLRSELPRGFKIQQV
jgi:two-component SAPR family response regulator